MNRSLRMRIAFEIVLDVGIERTGGSAVPFVIRALDKDNMGPAKALLDSLILGSRMGCSYALVVPRLSRGNSPGDTERDSGNGNQHRLPAHGSLLRSPMDASLTLIAA